MPDQTELMPLEVSHQYSLAKLNDRSRAALTKQALEHAVILTAMEEMAVKAAPRGEQRYKAIVDAYTLKTCKRIMNYRGGRL